MDKNQLITEVKNLIGNAEVEKAMDRLLEFLREDPKYRHLHSDLLQVRSQFRKAQRDESLGLSSSESTKLSYNRATQQVLGIVDRLERGRLEPEEEIKSGRNHLPLLLGFVIILLLAGGGYWWYSSRSGTGGGQAAGACPVNFRANSPFNILLLPFLPLNDNQLQPHVAINERLNQFKSQYEIDCDQELYPWKGGDFSSYPATPEDASEKAQNCRAQLIIWGTAESRGDSSIIQTNYKFLDRGDRLELEKLQVKEGTKINRVSTLSSISTGNQVTGEIEESIKLLFGLIAHETKNNAVAIDMLESYQPQDSSIILVRGMVLAEEYLAANNEELAVRSYDEVLNTHPNYMLARNNRGILYFKKGQYMEAAEDLSVALENDSTNVEILETRSEAYLKADQLKEARQDLNKIRELSPTTRTIDKKLEEVEQKIKREKKTQASAEAKLKLNPNNISALVQKAESSQKLGDYDLAIKSAESILQKDPDNIDAFVRMLQAYRSLGDASKIKEIIRRAEAAGIKREQLGERVPFNLNNLPISRPLIRRN